MSAANKPNPAIRDLRSTLAWLKSEGDLIETDKEVDPDLEIIGLQKHLDGGCPALFNNVKGKPNHRVVTNLFGDINVVNKMFGWTDDRDRTVKLAQALSHPITPVVIEGKAPPCQEVVIEKPKDVNEYMVPVRHTEQEPELTVGSGIRVISGDYFDGGTDLGYNRMNFRWGNVGTFQISPGSHMWQVVSKHYEDDKPVPITMCFGVPPACTLLAGAGFNYVILPQGCDEIGVAGAAQGLGLGVGAAARLGPAAAHHAAVAHQHATDGRIGPHGAQPTPRQGQGCAHVMDVVGVSRRRHPVFPRSPRSPWPRGSCDRPKRSARRPPGPGRPGSPSPSRRPPWSESRSRRGSPGAAGCC